MFDATRGRTIPGDAGAGARDRWDGTNATYVRTSFCVSTHGDTQGSPLIETSFATGHVESGQPGVCGCRGQDFSPGPSASDARLLTSMSGRQTNRGDRHHDAPKLLPPSPATETMQHGHRKKLSANHSA